MLVWVAMQMLSKRGTEWLCTVCVKRHWAAGAAGQGGGRSLPDGATGEGTVACQGVAHTAGGRPVLGCAPSPLLGVVPPRRKPLCWRSLMNLAHKNDSTPAYTRGELSDGIYSCSMPIACDLIPSVDGGT